MNWQLVLRLTSILPLIPGFIHSVETLHSGKSGDEKKQAVVDMVNTGLGATSFVAPGTTKVISNIAPGVGQVVDGLVSIFNSTGIFKSKPAVAS
jgi:hypothetical protein